MQQAAIPTEVAGGWKFEKVLGQGADGVVALFTKADQRAVLKFPTATGGASFEREKAVSAVIREQPRSHLLGQKFASDSFVAQDFVDGITLFRFGQDYDFNVDTANGIVSQIEAGVAALHQLGFAHNDLHLANMLIDPVTRNIWIIDYGRSAYTWEEMKGVPVTENDRAFIAATAAWLRNLATRPCLTRNKPSARELQKADQTYQRARDNALAALKPGLLPLKPPPPQVKPPPLVPFTMQLPNFPVQ